MSMETGHLGKSISGPRSVKGNKEYESSRLNPSRLLIFFFFLFGRPREGKTLRPDRLVQISSSYTRFTLRSFLHSQEAAGGGSGGIFPRLRPTPSNYLGLPERVRPEDKRGGGGDVTPDEDTWWVPFP